jgi:hypothetical protein
MATMICDFVAPLLDLQALARALSELPGSFESLTFWS